MEATEQKPESQQPVAGCSVCERLAAGRASRGLTIEDVAQELRLPPATLTALEEGRFDNLPEPIFVRGYLRAYGRLLEMDETALLEEYDQLIDTSEPVLTPTNKVRRQATATDPFIRGASYMIGFVMVVLVGIWWFSRLDTDVPPETQTASTQTPPTVEAPPPPQSGEDDGGADRNLAQITGAASETETAPVAEEPDPEPSGEPESEAGARDFEALPILPPVGESAPAADQEPEAAPSEENEAAAAPGEVSLPIAPLVADRGRLVRPSRAPSGDDVLVIKANEESWAEVVDANGYQLLYYLLRPGMERRIQGQAPFWVFFGNAPAIDLSLNQERFDHTPFHRPNSTARFSVDDAS